MFEKIFEAVKAYDTIIIHRHSSPDGDAMGSQIGLKNILKDNFPTKKIALRVYGRLGYGRN